MKDPFRFINTNPLHEDIKAYAVTYFLSREKKVDATELRRFAAGLMSAIAEACIARGAKVIGHIKAYIEHETGFLHANTVGESGDVTVGGRDGEPAQRFTLVVNSVIYGLAGESIREATERGVEETSSTFGFYRELVSEALSLGSL